MNPGEPSRERPYRSPAPKPAETSPDSTIHEPVENPLASFAKHEKSLAILDIYRQTIAACRTQRTIEDLKQTCRSTMVSRFPTGLDAGNTYQIMRGEAAEASVWLQKLTLDDAALFDQKKETTLSSNYASDIRNQTIAILVLGSLAIVSWFWNHLR